MSSANVITDVSETLRSILNDHLNPTGGLPNVGVPVTVTVDNPQRSAGEDLRVNLYLYHILQDESRRNTGPRLYTSATDYYQEPLALKLYYMVTAFAPEGATEHRLIGEAIQAFYQHRSLDGAVLKGSLATGPIRADKMQLVMLNQDLETLHRIWGNFQEALRPSTTYEVEGVFLDASPANEKAVSKLVEQRQFDIVAVPFLSEVAPAAARPGGTVRLYGANLDLRSPDPARSTSLVSILLNGARVTPLDDGRGNGAVNIAIPADTAPGTATVQVRIGDYVSQAIALQVLPP